MDEIEAARAALRRLERRKPKGRVRSLQLYDRDSGRDTFASPE